MVLSTLHTNTAIGAVTRLKDMGIEPFLLSSSLIGVIAQRLVRTLCPHCMTWREADTFEKQVFSIFIMNRCCSYLKPKGAIIVHI